MSLKASLFIRWAPCSPLTKRTTAGRDQAEDDVLVPGHVHAAARRVGHLPELGFVTDDRAVVACSATLLLACFAMCCSGAPCWHADRTGHQQEPQDPLGL